MDAQSRSITTGRLRARDPEQMTCTPPARPADCQLTRIGGVIGSAAPGHALDPPDGTGPAGPLVNERAVPPLWPDREYEPPAILTAHNRSSVAEGGWLLPVSAGRSCHLMQDESPAVSGACQPAQRAPRGPGRDRQGLAHSQRARPTTGPASRPAVCRRQRMRGPGQGSAVMALAGLCYPVRWCVGDDRVPLARGPDETRSKARARADLQE